MKINEETDFYHKIKSLSEELRMIKARNKDFKEKLTIEKGKSQKLKEKVKELEQNHNAIKEGGNEKLSTLNKKNWNLSSKIKDLEIVNDHLKRKFETSNKKMKNNRIMLGKEVRKYKEELENLEIFYRDKEKEWRLLTLKLKEFQRIGKFSKLTPLDLNSLKNTEDKRRATSTMRNDNFEILNNAKRNFSISKITPSDKNHITFETDYESHNKSELVATNKGN